MAENEVPQGYGEGNGLDSGPQIALLAQYVKDLSFENPASPGIYQNQTQPQIDVQFNIVTQAVAEDVHEVAMKIEASARAGEQTAFAIELVYAGLFGARGLSEEQLRPFLLSEAPRLLFPFARRIVADMVRDGNFPPLMLDPIDFGAMYAAQQAQAGQLAGVEPAGQA